MKILTIAMACLLLSAVVHAGDFDDLLEVIRSETERELEDSREREQRFLEAKESRVDLLTETEDELNRLTLESDTLTDSIDKNEKKLAELEERLSLKMGDLGELFGVVRQISGELAADFGQSMISAHFPGRVAYLTELSERKELPDMAALTHMWRLLLEELDESRKVARFSGTVIQGDGTVEEQKIVRIGAYGAVSRGKFLTYSPDGNAFAVALKQPGRRYSATAGNFDEKQDGLVKMMIDPTRGQLLGMLTRKPNLGDRIRQGGVIGYIILGLGIGGMALCLFRYGYLTMVMRRIKQQAADINMVTADNPLGRIAQVYRETREKPREQREVIWEEAILKEIPPVERYNTLIKLLAAISPLLGLLGTVTGMIITFQSITLFGTGDPQLMAGGISTALITTVMGLSVAIPILFAYTFIAAKSKSIVDMLEHQSVGLIAREIL